MKVSGVSYQNRVLAVVKFVNFLADQLVSGHLSAADQDGSVLSELQLFPDQLDERCAEGGVALDGANLVEKLLRAPDREEDLLACLLEAADPGWNICALDDLIPRGVHVLVHVIADQLVLVIREQVLVQVCSLSGVVDDELTNGASQARVRDLRHIEAAPVEVAAVLPLLVLAVYLVVLSVHFVDDGLHLAGQKPLKRIGARYQGVEPDTK